MLSRLYLILFLTCLIPMQLSASPQLTLSDNVSSYMDFNVEYLEETSLNPLNIDEVSALKFDNTQTNRFALGHKKKPVWFKFTIYNDSAKVRDVILEMTEIFYRTVDLYTLSQPPIKKVKNGLHVPLSEREIEKINPAFMLSFNPHETKKVYIKVESTYGLFGSIQLKNPKQFLKDTQTHNNMLIFYFGAILIIALYNLFIFLFFKEKIYLYFVGYILFFSLWVSAYKGILFYYIDIETYDLLRITLPASFLMLILFSQVLLESKTHFPLIHKILNGFIWLISIGLIWMLIDLPLACNFMDICIVLFLPFLLFAVLFASNKGYKIAKIYMFVLLIYFIGMSLFSMLELGLIKYSILLSYAPVMASFFLIILFTLLLVYRISLFRQKTLDAQNKLLEQQRSENSRLFHAVSEKTLALKNANKALSKELEEKKELEKHLKHHASTDPLTGLMNRRSYFKACEKEMEYATRYKTTLSFLTIDIDKFKDINDTYGHPFGDEVIRSLGELLTEDSRSIDYVARIGGEEFSILMPATGRDSAFHLADRLRANIARHKIIYENKVVQITVSIGLSHLTEEDKGIETIVKRSDDALYEAKGNGRNQVRCA